MSLFFGILLYVGEFWAGWDDISTEGIFRDANTGGPMSNELDLWYAGEPNGGRMENCAMVWVRKNAWNDLRCTASCFGFCYIDTRPRTKMRGDIFQFDFFFLLFVSFTILFYLQKDTKMTLFLIASTQCQQTS